MGFGEDLRGELFGKLGVESNVDPLKLIEQGIAEKSAGNNQGAKKVFEQAVEISNNQALKYIGQNQHRAAAEALYIQALATGHLGESDKQKSLYIQVVDSLLSAGQTAVAFGESNRGFACGTLAGMVALLYDDYDRAFAIYTEYMETSQDKENAGYLQKLLYSLGYLLDALKNDNIGALTDAQNFMSTDLKPMLSTAKLAGFESLLNTVLHYCQDVLQSKITMPKINVQTSLPRDIQFNQLFDFQLNLSNDGDGLANQVQINLSIPDDIEIVDGATEELIPEMHSSTNLDRILKLRFQTGDTSGAQIREIKGHISFVDMLNNSHRQLFGPIEIEFTAVSKKDEFLENLNKTKQPLAEINTTASPVPKFVFGIATKSVEEFSSLIRAEIEQEEFKRAELGINLLQKFVEDTLSMQISGSSTQEIEQEMSAIIQEANDKLRNELSAEFEMEKQQSLDALSAQKDQELSARVEQLKTDLSAEHHAEMNALKDEHQNALQEVRRENESKLNQALTQHESKLREEFKAEKDSMSFAQNAQIQEIENRQKQMVEDAEQRVRSEWSEKYDGKVKELEQNMEEMKQELQSSHENELRELRQQNNDQIAVKDREIQQLKSGSNPPQ
ncbi:MAG: hypothetical protein ACXAE3_14285 [Candidatus Kariarchaeaceae archaeon]|jgi:hypothetical protein